MTPSRILRSGSVRRPAATAGRPNEVTPVRTAAPTTSHRQATADPGGPNAVGFGWLGSDAGFRRFGDCG